MLRKGTTVEEMLKKGRSLLSCFNYHELILGVILVLLKPTFESLHFESFAYSIIPLLNTTRKHYSHMLLLTRLAKIRSGTQMLCPDDKVSRD